MIQKFVENIPVHFNGESGAVFYSGIDAFRGKKNLYLLGLNPGGSPVEQSSDTVEKSIQDLLAAKPDNWSAYRDDSWVGAKPGSWRMQPRVLHLLEKLGLDPGEVPSSNVIFLRSRRESDISNESRRLIDLCWPFHAAVIEELEPRTILCFGQTAGRNLRAKLDATKQIDEFIESNKRKWKSSAFINDDGVKVIIATHPSIADWTAPDTDPSDMVKRVMSLVS